MNIKLKLKRSREFLTGKRKHDGESSPLTSTKSTEFLFHPLSTRPKGVSILESSIRPVRAYTSPLPASPYSHLQSPPTPPVLTVPKHDFAQGDVEDDDQDMYAEPTPPDSFDNRLPIEIRLHIFKLLVMGFVDDLQTQVVRGQWSVAKAAETKWVGWEGGIRELVKISRVSRTWQALALDGQLWSTLGGSSAIPSALLSRISAIAGPFVRSLQLEGINTISSEDLVVITSKISLADHHAHSIDFPASVPVERWITNLTDINLAGTTVSTRALHKLLASCPLLEKLCLRGMNAVTNSTCIVIGDANSRLITLDLRQCPNMDSFGLTLIREAVDRRRAQEGGDNNPSPMRELRLSGLKRVSEPSMTCLAQSFPALEVLDLSYIASLTDECLERFVEWFETDDFTSLSPSPSSSPPDVVRLSSREVGLDPTDRAIYERRITRLRHLNLSYCPNLTDRCCSNLAHTVPQLEFLELAGIGAGLEDAGLVRLLKTTPFIRKIDLEDATHITDDVLAAITPSLTTRPTPSIAINASPLPPSSTSQSRFRTRTLPSHPPPPQPGEKLEHLVLSYASLISAPAFSALVHSCPRLRTLEVDNTHVTDEVLRDFVELCRERGTRNATITAIDCVSIARGIVDELAAQGSTRTRNGWRSWEASVAGLNYADAVDGDEDLAGGLDECDDRRVTVKSFRSWQMVDRWIQEKERRKEVTSGTTGASGYINCGSRRWFGRRSTVSGGGSTSVSGANTPGNEDDDRGCIIM
ncbi:hypothetical protein BS47DRAFT_1295613 [Hydnum rufescens UP504]|uniref:F-box domain-containing protein n=1 Tax=Hydnum rufescens UP504 TaxID=1448309 RepID=A0A9P6AXN1_9AGAM|nr:hypothetical protein BS47DRAFT_1295613 [Hydnum rufescens UP504]